MAGHQRHYTRAGLTETLRTADWTVEHMTGLPYPLSNWLLPLSNRPVRRFEAERVALTPGERTIASGKRAVPWKNAFPSPARVVLNEVVLAPSHLMLLVSGRRERVLVLYCEAAPAG